MIYCPKEIFFPSINVEAAELALFEGNERLLNQYTPSTIFEPTLDGLDEFGITPSNIWELFSRVGYMIFFGDSSKIVDLLTEKPLHTANRCPSIVIHFVALNHNDLRP